MATAIDAPSATLLLVLFAEEFSVIVCKNRDHGHKSAI